MVCKNKFMSGSGACIAILAVGIRPQQLLVLIAEKCYASMCSKSFVRSTDMSGGSIE